LLEKNKASVAGSGLIVASDRTRQSAEHSIDRSRGTPPGNKRGMTVERGKPPTDPDASAGTGEQLRSWGVFQPVVDGTRRAIAGIKRFEEPAKAAGRFTVVTAAVSFIGWLVTSVIQYNSWRTENDLKRYEEDLTQATKTFADASDAFSKALTLQQQLVYNYVDALDSADKDRTEFLWGQAHSVFDDAARRNLHRLAFR
jgi:hypothetical protein